MNLQTEIEEKVRENGCDEQLFYLTIAKKYGISQAYRRYTTFEGNIHGYETFIWEHKDGERKLLATFGYKDIMKLAKIIIENENFLEVLEEQNEN